MTQPDRALTRGGALALALAIIGFALLAATWPSAGMERVDGAWMAAMLPVREAAPWLVNVSYFLNSFGGGTWGTILVPVGLSLVFLAARRPWVAAYFLGASILSALAVQSFKQLFDRARPEEIIVASDHGSFPSGHTANAATIAVVFALVFARRWVAWLGLLYVLMMACSRTLLGAHWVSDTAAGALLGAAAAAIAWLYFGPRVRRASAAPARGPGPAVSEGPTAVS